MTKQEVAQQISERLNMPAKEVKKVVEELFEVIKEALAIGDTVHFRGFGNFMQKKRASKVVQDINKGKKMILPARKVPFFKPSKHF